MRKCRPLLSTSPLPAQQLAAPPFSRSCRQAGAFSAPTILINRLPAYFAQRDARFYPPWAIALAEMATQLPICFAEAWVWTLLVYFLVRALLMLGSCYNLRDVVGCCSGSACSLRQEVSEGQGVQALVHLHPQVASCRPPAESIPYVAHE